MDKQLELEEIQELILEADAYGLKQELIDNANAFFEFSERRFLSSSNTIGKLSLLESYQVSFLITITKLEDNE